MTEAMPFLQKAILLSYAPRSFRRGRYKKEKTRFCITQNAEKRASNIYQQYFSMIFCITSQLFSMSAVSLNWVRARLRF